MKILIAIFITTLLYSCSSTYRLEKLQNEQWTLHQKPNKIRYVQKDSLTFLCCIVSPLYHGDTVGTKYPYWIEIEILEYDDEEENKKRRHRQVQILDSLQKQSGKGKTEYTKYHDFAVNRNILPNLRVPTATKKGHSIYIKDALEDIGHLNMYFKHIEEALAVLEFRKKYSKH